LFYFISFHFHGIFPRPPWPYGWVRDTPWRGSFSHIVWLLLGAAVVVVAGGWWLVVQISLTGDYILSELVSPGQSGQFFYFSYDLRFMLKTITRGEAKFLKAILPKYYNVRPRPSARRRRRRQSPPPPSAAASFGGARSRAKGERGDGGGGWLTAN
jgi:hypothetical protein